MNRSQRKLSNWIKSAPRKSPAARKMEIALDPFVTKSEYSVIAFDVDLSAAKNPETPPDTLDRIHTKWYEDSILTQRSGRMDWINAELAANPNTPRHLLAWLSHHAKHCIARVATNPALAVLILEDIEWAQTRLSNDLLRLAAPALVEECLPTYGNDRHVEADDEDSIPF